MDRVRRVVITGLGMVTPMGCGVEATWRRLVAGESAAARVENFDVSDLPCQIAAQVPRGAGRTHSIPTIGWIRRSSDASTTSSSTA